MKKTRFISYIISISFIITAFLGTVHFCCFDENFYTKQHEKIMLFGKHINEHIGISNDDLKELTSFTLNYLNDSNLTLDKRMIINGEIREVFTNDEKAHMIDVQRLNISANRIMIVSSIVFILFFVYYIFSIKNWKTLFKNYIDCLKSFLIVFTFIALWVFIDFDSFWTLFHRIFFSGNDLWLLNLKTDILIMIVPPEFFNNLVIRILIIFILTIMIFALVLNLINRKKTIND